MNRKSINRIINRVTPVSSKIIGSPRNSATANSYFEMNPSSLLTCSEKEIFKDGGMQERPALFAAYQPKTSFAYFLLKLRNARVWGRNGAVITAEDIFIENVSREFNKGTGFDHSVFYTLKQRRVKKQNGKVAVIGTAGAGIYYHWMLDILPRLGILSTVVDLDTIDFFVTEYNELPFQKNSLTIAGINEHKIIRSNENWNFHLESNELFVPSLAGPLDQPTPFQINYLRTIFHNLISTKGNSRKIYISRKNVQRRMIVNELEVIEFLSKNGFDTIYCEEMTIEDQVRIFSEAMIVVGSHGSAFTNLVFCQPGTFVVDIFNPRHINPCFWHISQINHLLYSAIIGDARPIDLNPKNDNTYIDLSVLQKQIGQIGV